MDGLIFMTVSGPHRKAQLQRRAVICGTNTPQKPCRCVFFSSDVAVDSTSILLSSMSDQGNGFCCTFRDKETSGAKVKHESSRGRQEDAAVCIIAQVVFL